jgi:hypothetical protein
MDLCAYPNGVVSASSSLICARSHEPGGGRPAVPHALRFLVKRARFDFPAGCPTHRICTWAHSNDLHLIGPSASLQFLY